MKLIRPAIFLSLIASISLYSGYVMASKDADSSTTYNNMFIAYSSPANVKALASYANDSKINGFILWEIQGDMPANDSNSLLKTASDSGAFANRVAYYADWDAYMSSHKIPGKPYLFTGAKQGSSTVTNTDLDNKAKLLTGLNYAFAETIPQYYCPSQQVKDPSQPIVAGNTNGNCAINVLDVDKSLPVTNPTGGKSESPVGTIYFFDPWTDLSQGDKDSAYCKGGDNLTCGFVMKANQAIKPDGKTWKDYANAGNFRAFSELQNTGKNLQKYLSVGGYGHDASFEAIFSPTDDPTGQKPATVAQQNFVNSAVSIINEYGLAGIDLDYENPGMTHAQSESFLSLVTYLSNALAPLNKQITVTVLADPLYLQGNRQQGSNPNAGFDKGVLPKLAALSQVKSINLMTYDFHGAFDFAQGGTNKTGFNTNLYNNDTYAPKFSVQASVNELTTNQGIDPSKILAGIPAYGRAIANIDPGSDGTGLGQGVISGAAGILLPGGDMDDGSCTPTVGGTCTGMFQYSYIVNNLLKQGFKQTVWSDEGGTTAYATKWAQGGGAGTAHNLTITNGGTSSATNLGYQIEFKTAEGNLVQSSQAAGPWESDFLNPAASKTYTATGYVNTTDLAGKGALTVEAVWYGGTTPCSGLTYDPSKGNATLTVTLGNQAPVQSTCSVSYSSSN